MSSLPVARYITPSTTSGSASNLYLAPLPDPRRAIQLPLRSPTLPVLIRSSVEYRWLFNAPPNVIQLLPPLVAFANSSCVGERNDGAEVDCAHVVVGSNKHTEITS